MTLEDLTATGLVMLLSEEGEFWQYFETDLDWWELHLWTKRN